MSDDSDASLPLPGSPAAGPGDNPEDCDSGSDQPTITPSRKIILQMSSPEEATVPSPSLPLDEIPYPTELIEKGNSIDPEPEVEIPLPPDSSDSKYSPSQASAEDASPASETQQKKTVAVLGRAQAMKRLKAFSAAKLAATSTTSGSGVKKSPIKGVSVFSGKSSSDSKQPPLAIASIKEEETKMREILAMNSLLNEKLKTVHAITGSIPGPGPATAIVKPTLLNPEFRSNPDPLDKSDLPGKTSEDKITSFHVKKQVKNIRRKRASSSSSVSRSRSKSPGVKRRVNERRSRSRDRDKERDRDRDSYRRDRERDRVRERERENERKRVKRSRSRSKNRDHDRRRSKSPRSKDKTRRRSRTRSRDRKRRSRSRERKKSPSRSLSREKEKDGKNREKSPTIREIKRKSVSPLPLREKKQKSLSPLPLRKSRSQSLSRERRKSRSRSKSAELKTEKTEGRKKSRSRSREREGKSRRKSPSKHKKKDKDRDRDRDREREKEKLLEKERREKEEKKEAERKRERERQEAVERELDKVRTIRMPVDWKEYKKFQYSPDNVRDVWNSIFKDSKARSRSRSSSRSPSRAKELPSSPTFSRTLIQSPKLIKTVQVELRTAIKRDYPVEFLKMTKQKPVLEYGCNRLSLKGYFKSRDVFKEESPEVLKSVETILCPDLASKMPPSPPDPPKVQPWFVEHAQLFCPTEGSKGIVISHLYSDEEMEEAPLIRSKLSTIIKAEKPVKKAEVSAEPSKSVPVLASSSTSTTATRPSSQSEPMEEEYSTESSQSQDSVPSPLLKTRYGADLPPPPVSSLPLPKIAEEGKPLSDVEDVEEEEVEELPVLPKSVPPLEEKKPKIKDKKKEKRKKKKKDSKKHHRRHRRDSKKHTKSDDEDESEDKIQDSESSRSDDGGKSKALKKKKSRRDEEEPPATKSSSKVVLEDSKKKTSKVTSSSSGKISKKHSKKSRKGKHSESDETEQSSSSEDSKESSSSSSGSESDGKERKKKKKRAHRKKRDKKEDKDESSDDEPHDRGDKGGAGGTSGRSGGTNDRSRSHRRDKDNKDRDRDRDRRRSRDRDRERDRSDRKKRRHDCLDLETHGSVEDSKHGSSSTSSSSSYSSSQSNSSNDSSSYSSANEDDEHASLMNMHPDSQFQLALQISKIQQIGLDDKTENDSQIISKLLTQIEHDEIMGSMEKVGGNEKYDPFLDVHVEDDMKMGIPIVVSGTSVGSNFTNMKIEPELSGAEDLLKTCENDPLLQLVMTDQDLSAENLLAQIYEPDHQEALSGNVKDEVNPSCSAIPTIPPTRSIQRKKVEAVIESQLITAVTSPAHKAEAIKANVPKEETVLHHRKNKDLVAVLDANRYVDTYELSPGFEHTEETHRSVEDSRRSDRTFRRSYSRSYSRSRSRSRSRSVSPSIRRHGRSRKIIQDRRYHPYHDRHDRYRSNERRERYIEGHRGREIRGKDYEERYSRFDRHRHCRDGRERGRPIVFRHRDRSLEEYELLGHASRRYERISRPEKDRMAFENHYREELVVDRGDRAHEDLITEKPITTICHVNPPVPSEADLVGAEASPPLRLNVADSTINDSDLADNIALGFVDNVEDNRGNWSNLKEIIPESDSTVVSVLDSSAPAPGYISPPKRLSLDERLEMEMGIKLREEVTPAHPSFPFSVFPPGQDDFAPGECQAPKGDSGWLPQVPIQGVQADAHEVPRTVPRQSQAIPLGDLIQVLPGQMLDRSFTVTKQNSKLNPFEVQQTATQVIRKVGDEMDPKKCVNIKVPVLPFKIPVFGHPDLESIQAAEQEKENRILLRRQEKEQKRLEKKRRQHEKRKQLLKKRMLKKKEMMAKKKLAMEAAKREREEKSSKTRESNNVGTELESATTAVDPEELKLLKEALTEVPTDLAEDYDGHAPISTEPELIRDKILPVDDMHDADEHEEDMEATKDPASPKQSSNLELPNSEVNQVKITLPKKGILYMTGLKKEKSSKGVKFADGVLPGHGSSRSEGEDIHSPPPGQENIVKKKKKVKVGREKKKAKAKPVIEIDPNAPKLPPPPPPKEPYPYCPLGILYQFNPPYAIVYAQTLAELGYEITFTPSMETPKDFAGEELEADESHSVQIESLNQSVPSTTVPMSELGVAAPAKTSAWSESPDAKDRVRKKRKHREHKDIDLKTQSASTVDPPSSRHSSHRHKEHKHKPTHAQRIPTIVSSVPSSKLSDDSIPPQDFHPVDGGRITPRIMKELESDPQPSVRENKNLISLSSHHEEHIVATLHDTNTMKNLPFEGNMDVAVKPEVPVECKRIENNRFKHHENHRVRNRHVDNNRIVAHNKHYENHRVEHHKTSESHHHLDSPKQLENHRLERKLSDKRSEYGHSEWKSERKILEKTSDNPNLIQISPSKLDLSNKSTLELPKNKKAFTESFVEVPQTPEQDAEKIPEFQTIAPIPIINRTKQIKIKMNMKSFNKVSDSSVLLAMRPALTGKINSAPVTPVIVPNAINCKDLCSSSIAPPNVLPAVTLSPVSSIVSQIPSSQSSSPNVQIPVLHPPTYDYYNQIPAMVSPLNIPPVPPIIPPTISPRLPCGIDLTRPPPAFASSSPTAAVNARALSPTFAAATRVPGVRITHSSPGQSRRPLHKGNRS